MSLSSGARLGPYEIKSTLGAGGMGEVYRAHDDRLGRDVAVKVISSGAAAPAGFVERFRQEARALAALDHPHILALHDFGAEGEQLYAVFELLEGKTLRQRLQEGVLPPRKAIELGVQVCRGLHAAHLRGVIHRDLKPENLFLAADGHLKILDFGLAELRAAGEAPLGPRAGDTSTPTGAMPSGTFGYMSPEQLRGQPVGAPADLFSLGVVLFEMVSGRRPFEAATTPESLAAVLTRDPPELASPSGALPPALEPIVRRCLEKEPGDRFQSAHDLALALEAVLGGAATSGQGRTGGATARRAAEAAAASRRNRRVVAAAAAFALLAAGALLGRALQRPSSPPSFTQLTFRRGWINFARFAKDGRTVVYTAAWDGGPPEIYTTRTDSRLSQPLGLRHAALLSVSSKGELAILLDPHKQSGLFTVGVLATVPLGGGDPRELLDGVQEADWAPDGKTLAVLRASAGGAQAVEMPPGQEIYRAAGGLRLLRVSPDGRRLALVEGEADRRLVTVEVASRRATVLAASLPSNLFGLAWARAGAEVWLTLGDSAAARDVVAFPAGGGPRRLVYRSLSATSLLDVGDDGRALLLRGSDRWGTHALLPGESGERDLSVFDFTVPASLSPDGRTVLLDEFSQAAGPAGGVYLRRPGGSLVRLADGTGCDLSPDGRAVLVRVDDPPRLLNVPQGPALQRALALGPVVPRWAKWVPGGEGRAVVLGHEPDRPLRLWLVGGAPPPRPLSPESGPAFFAVSPDGAQVAARLEPGRVSLLPLSTAPGADAPPAARVIEGLPDDLVVGSFSGDGRSLFLVRTSVSFPCEVHRLDLATGRVDLWKRVAPADATGISQCAWMNLSADGRAYAYGYFRSLADLILAEGLQ